MQYVTDGNTATFTVTPDNGYTAIIGGTCPAGTLNNNLYTTGTISGDCTVTATFNSASTSLALVVTDNHTFARYGMLLDYVVTVSNNTGTDITGMTISGNTAPDPDLDIAAGSWVCFGSNTQCASSGTGAFADAITVPASGSVSWVVTEPVLSNAADATASCTVTLNGPSFASPITQTDVDTLVIFHDGFDVPYADGTQAAEPTVTSTWDGTSALTLTRWMARRALRPRPFWPRAALRIRVSDSSACKGPNKAGCGPW